MNQPGADAPLTAEQIAAAELRAKKEGYIHRLLVGIDQLAATALDIPNDQTISSQTEIAAHKRAWYAGIARLLNDGLDELQKSHGQKAQAGDIARAERTIAADSAALRSETGASPVPIETGEDAVPFESKK